MATAEAEISSSSSSPPSKKPKLTDHPDRLTNLPEPLLLQILSLLDTKQVVQTCILSHKWRHIWRSLQSLDFNDLKWYLSQTGTSRKFKRSKFRFFVDSVLRLRDGSDIQRFSIYLSSSSPKDCNRLDRWIMYALKRNVRKLTFGATEFFHYNPLRLIGNVKSLELKGVFLHDYPNDDGELVLNFPLVEDLLLEHCGYCRVKRLIINAPKLKIFVLDSYEKSLNCSTVVKVCSPKLLALRCNGFMFKGYRLEDLSRVYLVWIDTIVNPAGLPEMDAAVFGRCLNNMLTGLPNVRYLTLSAHGLQSFPEFPDILEWEPVSCHKLKYLKLKMIRWSKNAHIRPLANVLNHFPNLETLVLEKNEEAFSESETEEADWESQLSFECSLNHLKYVECHDLEVCQQELDFLAFLLRNATVLEKITISFPITDIGEDNGEADFCSRLFSLPQTSPSVAISYAFVAIV